MSEFPKPPEDKPPASAPGAEQAAQPDVGEAALVQNAAHELQNVPDPAGLGGEGFLQSRAGTLRGVWNKAKAVVGRIGDAFAIEQDGYRLSPAENIKARFANFGVLYRAITARTSEERQGIMQQNPVVDAAVNRRYARPDLQARSSEENFADRSKADLAKIAAYELTTLPVVRLGGLMALHGAAKAVAKVTGSETAGKVQDSLNYRLELHEQGLHNPTLRKLNGVRWEDVKPGNIPQMDKLPIVDPKKDDLSGMDGSAMVRVNVRSPFAEDQTPSHVITTVDQLRSRTAFEQIAEAPAAQIKAAADERATKTTSKASAPLRAPFEN